MPDLKEFLDEKYELYNRPSFIESDPIQIPHRFSRKEDIEIAAFLTSSIAWGNRKMIIRSAENIIKILNNEPYHFILNAVTKDFQKTEKFVHRTFNASDLSFFLASLQNIYRNYGGLESVFETGFHSDNSVFSAIAHFRKIFFSINHPEHCCKHVSDVEKNSAAKRINMFLMWLVRNDKRGVHFGLWKNIPTSELKIPLDLHSGNTARTLGFITRRQNDWKTVEELTNRLKQFDPNDPVKYDFALFGLGVFEQFWK
jgi:uncharacterized protein (TIGR02757 family)